MVRARARCTAARSRSRGPARRRAGSRRGSRELGAEVVEAPAIRIEPRSTRPRSTRRSQRIAAAYDVVCLTSPNGAELLLDALSGGGRDARALAGATLAAIGPGHGRARCARRGIARRRRARALDRRVARGRAARARRRGQARAGRARGRGARRAARRAASAPAPRCEVVALYETVREELGERARGAARGRRLRDLHQLLDRALPARGARRRGALPDRARVVSIGPVTSDTARELGLEVDVEADAPRRRRARRRAAARRATLASAP